ncbi:hypothetical protein ONS96_009549 [Cadophora gregata f. sp. sojae]|nr:hypothetical protein ONS96_009549 [Cadophora gregata f. sp. sojae]
MFGNLKNAENPLHQQTKEPDQNSQPDMDTRPIFRLCPPKIITRSFSSQPPTSKMIRLLNDQWTFAGPASNNGKPITETNPYNPAAAPQPPRTPLPNGQPGLQIPGGFVEEYNHSAYALRENPFLDYHFFYKS